MQTVDKDDLELFIDLKEKLEILKDSLEGLSKGKRHSLQVLTVALRSLICDYKNKGGLLTYLVSKYGFTEQIGIEDRGVSLEEYRNSVSEKMTSGSKSEARTRCRIICDMAEQDGLAHGALRRKSQHSRFLAITMLGRTKKTDLLFGMFGLWGQDVLTFGNQFFTSTKNGRF